MRTHYRQYMRWQLITAVPVGLSLGLWLIFARRWMLGTAITYAGGFIVIVVVRVVIGRFFPVKINGE